MRLRPAREPHFHLGTLEKYVAGTPDGRSLPYLSPVPPADMTRWTLAPSALRTHALVVGRTGSGKSCFLNLLARAMMDAFPRRGFAIIDPGDLCEDVLAYRARQVLETGHRGLLKCVHYLELTFRRVFRYDPFRFLPPEGLSPEEWDAAYRSWALAKADTFSEVVQLAQGQMDFEGMARLQRVLRNVTVATAMAVDATGRHLPFSDVLVLLNLEHKRHKDVFRRVEPLLDSEVLADFARLHAYTRVEDRMRETESTINRLRSILTPLVKASLSATADEPVVDLYSIIQNQEILLVNVRKTPFFSDAQKSFLGKMFIHDIIATMEATPRHRRKEYTLIVDEAGEFASEVLKRSLGANRKHRLQLVLSAQDLSSFRKGDDFDMVNKAVTQPGLLVCFEQRWPEDLDILARILFSGDWDWTPLTHETEFSDGYDWVPVRETGETRQRNTTWSRTLGSETSTTDSAQHTDSHARKESRSTAEKTDAHGRQTGRSVAHTSGSDASHAETRGRAMSAGQSQSATDGGGESFGTSVTNRVVPLARVKREAIRTGKLETAFADQLEKRKADVANLDVRQAIVKIAGITQSLAVRVRELVPPFSSPEALAKAVEWVKRELAAVHPYFATPVLHPAEEDRRLAAFIGNETTSPGLSANGTRNGHAGDANAQPAPLL